MQLKMTYTAVLEGFSKCDFMKNLFLDAQVFYLTLGI